MASPGTVRTISEKLRMLVRSIVACVMAVMLIGTRLIEVACFVAVTTISPGWATSWAWAARQHGPQGQRARQAQFRFRFKHMRKSP
jgi:hypothetical protein